MKFTKENVRNMAETLHLALNEDEVNAVHQKVGEFCVHIEEMLKEDVSNENAYILSTNQTNVFQEEMENEEFDMKHLKSTLNDFENDYFVIKKVMEDE